MANEFIRKALSVYAAKDTKESTLCKEGGLREYRRLLIRQLNLRIEPSNIKQNGETHTPRIANNSNGSHCLPEGVVVDHIIRQSDRFIVKPHDPIVVHIRRRKMKRNP